MGSMRTSDRGVDFWLKKHDSNGQLLWKRSIGGNDYESLRDVIKTNDGGYLVIAESSSFNDYTSMYIIKIDSLGQGNYTNPIEMIPKINNELVIFPNPANDKVCIEILDNDKNYTIEIYDINGKQTFNQTSFVNQNFIDVTSWKNGMYLIRVNNKNATYQSKLIINH
jgi:DNA-binding beta-propeller fold protein YncE